MANSKAIELKGIVRNQTKIGVQDGQCDDIVNLKFKDGSWRVSADGKVIENGVGNAFSVSPYTQLYVHTNVYHHLLGVANGKLWWFANIDADNETFSYVTDNEGDPDAIEICDIQGDVTIVQNGHLLTIIGEGKSSMNYIIFKNGTNEYKELKVNPNGEKTDRGIYPFERVHLNLDCEAKEFTHTNKDAGKIEMDLENAGENFFTTLNHNTSGALVPADNNEDAGRTLTAKQLWHSSMLDVYNQAKDENYFTKPFLAIVAVKLYDGSYIYASAPMLLSPIEKYSSYKEYYDGVTLADKVTSNEDELYYQNNMAHPDDEETILYDSGYDQKLQVKKVKVSDTQILYSNGARTLSRPMGARMPVYYSGAYSYRIGVGSDATADPYYTDEYLEEKLGYLPYQYLTSVLRGSRLVVTLGDMSSIFDNSDVFTSLSIFITKEVDIYKMGADNYKDGKVAYLSDAERRDNADGATASYTIVGNVWYKPAIRPDNEIAYDLINSPFYLLREYSINELKTMSNASIEVDLSAPQYKGLLANIEQQPTLNTEAFDRQDFFPRTAYSYNQKLHIANYQSNQFHGYPIDCFQLSNHNVKIKSDGYAVGGVLPNLIDGSDVQYSRSKHPFLDHSPLLYDQYIQVSKDKGYCFAYVRVLIETQQGDQQVVRYIQPYDAYKFTNGDNANFVESLCPLTTFPDYRAKEMEVAVISLHEGRVYRRSKTFNLTPHQYLNIAYYIDPQLKPIDLPVVGSSTGVDFNDFLTNSQIGLFVTPSERNNTEDYPNGLKVSLTNNPFTFPYESTYQVGSSEIVALMSNAVAVGTGQTGAAPLYVFCKDGIYALLVDSTGEMTYTNARIIARDVCNNAKSVTPIDDGVVFTTDRGLMSIAGNEVLELGAAAEGDVFDITDTSDKAKKIMFNAFKMEKLGSLPQELLDNVDFLTYLKESIVNYDHNDRELMVSNPNYDYTYVMDRNSQWSRRDIKAVAYVNNYPTSYRVTEDGKLYKVDVEENVRGNCYLLSNVIKLGTISFKQAYRLAVRGYFDVRYTKRLKGSINGVVVYALGSYVDNMDPTRTINIRYVQKYGMYTWEDADNGTTLSTALYIYDEETNKDVTDTIAQVDGQIFQLVADDETYSLGCYVFGSYDGRKWALLGGNEKKGKFTDIGCNISHTDMKYLRLCLAGQLSKDSRIDFIEIEADGSVLNNKLR